MFNKHLVIALSILTVFAVTVKAQTYQNENSIEELKQDVKTVINDCMADIWGGHYDEARSKLNLLRKTGISDIDTQVTLFQQEIEYLSLNRFKALSTLYNNIKGVDIEGPIKIISRMIQKETAKKNSRLLVKVLQFEKHKLETIKKLYKEISVSLDAAQGIEIRLGGIKGELQEWHNNRIALNVSGVEMPVILAAISPEELCAGISKVTAISGKQYSPIGIANLFELANNTDKARTYILASGVTIKDQYLSVLKANHAIKTAMLSPQAKKQSLAIVKKDQTINAAIAKTKNKVFESRIKRKIAKYESSIAKYTKEISQLQSKLNSNTEKIAEQKDLASAYQVFTAITVKYQNEITSINKMIKSLEKENTHIQKQIQAYNKEIKRIENELEKIKKQLL